MSTFDWNKYVGRVGPEKAERDLRRLKYLGKSGNAHYWVQPLTGDIVFNYSGSTSDTVYVPSAFKHKVPTKIREGARLEKKALRRT